MHFRVTARDNHPGFGGRDFADVALNVAPGTGPFRLTSQATGSATAGGAALPVTWDVAGTDANGVNTSGQDQPVARRRPDVLEGARRRHAQRRLRGRHAPARGHGRRPHQGRGRRQRLLRRRARRAGDRLRLAGARQRPAGRGPRRRGRRLRRRGDDDHVHQRRPRARDHRRAHARRRRRRRREHRVRRVQRADARRLQRVRGHRPARPDPRGRAVRDAQPREQRSGLARDRRADRHGHGGGAGTAGRRRWRPVDADRARLRPGARSPPDCSA